MTTPRDARDDWRRFPAGAIPSKDSTPHLDAFLDAIAAAANGTPATLLDVGCGDGRLSRRISDRGFSVLGVDINPDAIRAARELPTPRDAGRTLPFDIVVSQLVISIIGPSRNRANLLRHMRDVLRPGGHLFLSASGVSDAINPDYARLYATCRSGR